MRWSDGISDSMDNGFEWTPGVGVDREAWRAGIHGVPRSRIRLSDLPDLTDLIRRMCI